MVILWQDNLGRDRAVTLGQWESLRVWHLILYPLEGNGYAFQNILHSIVLQFKTHIYIID